MSSRNSECAKSRPTDCPRQMPDVPFRLGIPSHWFIFVVYHI
jgi:hypothetical protein